MFLFRGSWVVFERVKVIICYEIGFFILRYLFKRDGRFFYTRICVRMFIVVLYTGSIRGFLFGFLGGLILFGGWG